LKSGSLSLLEPSGPVQASNGIALALYIFYFKWKECETFYFGHPVSLCFTE